MVSHIALLRGINVGGNMLKMDRLREIFAGLGLADVKTYLQSGNVLFTANEKPQVLADMIEKQIGRETRLPVSAIIRTPAQLKRVIAANPFLEGAGANGGMLHVTFLAGVASKAGLAALAKVEAGADRWHAAGSEIYLRCPDGYGRSKLNNTAIEKRLGVRATTRNWNTVTALDALCAQ
jgi:uncharacterized protein (DUF1697 family)